MIGRLFAALFRRPCASCKTPIGLTTALCESCVAHLRLTQMWAYYDAHDERLRNPAKYRDALKAAREWLAANPPQREAATAAITTDAKETSS